METLVLMIDTAAVIVVVYFSIRNEQRGSDADEIGPFRLRSLLRPRPSAPSAVVPARRRRVRGL